MTMQSYTASVIGVAMSNRMHITVLQRYQFAYMNVMTEHNDHNENDEKVPQVENRAVEALY